ncbi:MAG: signal peptidase I [Candidatus Sericytochromatia bacterium]|nr:signal peptidase I [Candidatus Sericytochromatia bacterium]
MHNPPPSEESEIPAAETPDNDSTQNPPKKHAKPLELIETIVVAVLLAILIRATVAEARFIPSGSMIPTLAIGDRLVVEKISYYFSDPERGDIVVFYPPNPAQQELSAGGRFMRWLGFTREAAYIKRVVGLPGETLSVRDGQVYINDEPLKESYTEFPALDETPPTHIPENHYFMMGDNRNNSKDSRAWGSMPRENVIGKAFFRFWPMSRLGMP